MENLSNQVDKTHSNNISSRQFLLDYFKNEILFEQLEVFPKKFNHLENMQLIVGSFINIGYSQAPNIQMQISSVKKLRSYAKYEQNLFYTIFISINRSLLKSLLSVKSNSELRKTAYLIFFDFILNYESFTEIDFINIFAFIFKDLLEIIVSENSEDPDDIPKLLMNLISNTLFYQEIYSKILLIANKSKTSKHLDLSLKVLKSLLINTPKQYLFELIEWKELFELFFNKDAGSKSRREEMYIELFNLMLNLINNDFSIIGLEAETTYQVKNYIMNYIENKFYC